MPRPLTRAATGFIAVALAGTMAAQDEPPNRPRRPEPLSIDPLPHLQELYLPEPPGCEDHDPIAPSLGGASLGVPVDVRPYRLPPNLLEYFREKYPDLVEESLTSTLRETPHGPLGSIGLRRGSPARRDVGGAITEERARAASLAFLMEEARLLDIADFAELREDSVKILEEGFAIAHYYRCIGRLRLVGAMIRIHVSTEDKVDYFQASLVPVSPELRLAATMKTLSQEEAIRIVRRDLEFGANGQPIRIVGRPRKVALWRPPYVVWGVGASKPGKPYWGYSVDAFSGGIVSKACSAHPFIPTPGVTLCD